MDHGSGTTCIFVDGSGEFQGPMGQDGQWDYWYTYL